MPMGSITGLLLASGKLTWSVFGKQVLEQATTVAKQQWQKIKWDKAAEKYCSKLAKLHGTMRILGMKDPVPLNDIFANAYILDLPTARRRFNVEELMRIQSDAHDKPQDAKPQEGLYLLKTHKNLFILGKPGAGKTTFLKYVTLQAAQGNLAHQVEDKRVMQTPIFVSLYEWATSGKNLMKYIAEQFDVCDFPNAAPFIKVLLRAGAAIVLFDGLDEVTQENDKRIEQIHAIRRFARKYGKAQCLITCRNAATDYNFEGFTYVEMADFNSQQVVKFVENWFRQKPSAAEQFLKEFNSDNNERLRELASSPLLLTLLCLNYEETLNFPQRRAEIYEEALDALLKKWNTSRGIKHDEVYKKLSLGHKRQMFYQIARRTFENNDYFIKQEDLSRQIVNYIRHIPPTQAKEEIDGEVALKSIEAQHGIFVERAQKIYSFSHLTFQEYFAAKYIIENAAAGELDRLLAHCAEPRWREVFLLTVSLLPETVVRYFLSDFRQAIDRELKRDAELNNFLIWADKKSKMTMTNSQLMRGYYLLIGGYWEDYLALDLALDVNLDLALDLALTRALARVGFRYNNYAFTPTFALALALDLPYIFSRARALDRNLARAVARDHDCRLARTHAYQLGLYDLASELKSLHLPNNETADIEWQSAAEELCSIMLKHRDIGHDFQLTSEKSRNLTNYFNANRLLKDCLELASMSPAAKEELLESLWLPPKQ